MSSPNSARPPTGNAPETLVSEGSITLGSWEGIPGKTNLIDAERPYHYPLPRFLRRLRLKEWQAIEAGDEDWFLLAVLYDAKFISMASVDVWDRKNKKKAGFRHLFPGSRFSMPQNFGSCETHASAGGDTIAIRIDAGKSLLSLNILSRTRKAGKDAFSIDLGFDLSEKIASPFSVCLPLSLNCAMYSTKILMPCSGTISVAGGEHRFDPSLASGILDDHKGYYPYRLHYDWVTGFGVDAAGRRIGFNLTDNQVKDQVRYNENRLWIDGTVHTLPPVKVTRPRGPDSPWNIQDTEGMVDLVFHPEVSHDIQVKLGIAEIDYAGPFGRFEGRLRTPSGETIEASPLYGMGEDKRMRI